MATATKKIVDQIKAEAEADAKKSEPAKKPTAFKFMTVKEMDEAYALLSKTQTELNTLIQKLAINAIGYSIKHGDIRPANRLIERFDGGLRRQALVTYLEVHGYLEYKTEGKSQSFVINRGKVEKIFDHEALADLPWYKAKAEVVSSIYDVKDVVQKFLKSIQARTTGGKQVKNVSLAVYVQEAFEQWQKDEAEALAERTQKSPADLANAAQQVGEVTDVGAVVEEMEQRHAPQRRAADRKVVVAH